jgi:hypothetical protein
MADIFSDQLLNFETHISIVYNLVITRLITGQRWDLTLSPSQLSQDGKGQNIQTLAHNMFEKY